MKLSVIIPCYKVEQYLPECLDSVFSQYFEGMEVIAVNDGSPDNCIDILKAYEARYPDILKIIDQENGGLSNARNSGIDICTGEYVCVLDSDDKYADDVLLKAYNICAEDNLDVLYMRADTFHDDTPDEYESWYDDDSFIDGSITDIMTGPCALNLMKEDLTYKANTWLMVCRKSFLTDNKIRYLEGTTYEGGPYSYEVFLKAKRVRIHNSIFVHYRIREGSITQSKPSAAMVHDLLKTLIRKMELFEECMDDVELNDGIYWRVARRKQFTSISYSRLPKDEKKLFRELLSPREKMYFNTIIKDDAAKRRKIRKLEKEILTLKGE